MKGSLIYTGAMISGRGPAVQTQRATQIALDCLGRSLFNSPMMGALVQAAELMPLEKFLVQVEKTLSKSFPQGIVKGNLEAIKRAAEEVSE